MSQQHVSCEYSLGRSGRVLLLGWGLFLLAGFAVALSLEPDPRGFGTHQRLGLPECTFRQLFTIPCPGCGMTTSFAHFVRGQFDRSASANPAGLLLAVICALLVPWSLASAVRGRLWMVSRPDITLLCILLSIGVVSLLHWGWLLIG